MISYITYTMKKFILLLLVSALFVSCTENLVTGRKQLSLVSETELQTLAKQEYQTFLTDNKVVNVSNNRDAEMVRRVGNRIASGIKTFYDGKGMTTVLEGYQWEFNLIDNKEANAWCMPGGKVVVYTGLLPITQNEAALAIVLGHEIAHAISQHGSERMSQALLQQLGGVALQVALANKPTETQNLFELESLSESYCLSPVKKNQKQISMVYIFQLWQVIIHRKLFLFGKECLQLGEQSHLSS